jgi:hypothetical protein
MNKKGSEQLLRAWRNGVSLNAALDLFDAKFDRSELAEKRQSHLRALQIGKRNFERIGAPLMSDDDLQQLGKGLSRLSAAGLAHKSKQTQLIEALEGGDLVALGYSIDRPHAQAPEPVPQFLIQLRYANFRKSEFSDGEHRYSNVRIAAADALPTVEIGRPSLRNSIFDLASVLAERGEITRDTPPKVQASKIRKLGNLNESTLSDQTIRRHLKSFWDT